MELLDSFHFARPWALLLLPLIIIQVIWYLRFRHASNPWQERMRPDLQQQLLARPEKQPSYLLWTILALTLTGVALAGPSWSQQSRPAMVKQDNLVIVLDLSLSMLAEDIAPNRITRSKQKLQDLLKQRKEGMTALVAYSGDAHTVTPLTQDTATIRNLLPALDPLMMPKLGSAAEVGINKAVELVRQSGFRKARLLLITDGLDEAAQKAIRKQLPDSMKLSIMSVGTAAGAPIPLDDQGFVKDQQGNVIISRLDQAEIDSFAADVAGLSHPITLNEQDLSYLLPEEINPQQIKETRAQLPLWIEQGHWFLLPVLPLVALAFRRNWLLMLPLLILLSAPKPVLAFWPADPQAEGEQAFQQGHYDQAEELLEDPLWRGSAYYRQKDYQKAISEFAKSDTPQAHYNRGNALAKLGRFDEAMSAYSKALEQNPNLKDAEHNRQLVETLLKQQNSEQEASQQEQGEGSQNQQNQNPQNSPSGQSGSQQQGSQPSSSQRQSTQQQSSEKGSTGSSGMTQNNLPQDSLLSEDQTNGPSPDRHSPDRQSSLDENGQDLGPDDDSAMFGNPNETNVNESEELDQAVLDKLADAQRKQQQDAQSAADAAVGSEGMSEEELSLEQWLRRIPDDPAGLLRRKFEYEANQRREPLPEGRAPW